MQLEKAAATNGPQKTGAAMVQKGTMGAVAKQGQRIPAQAGGTLRPVVAGGQEIVAVAQELAPPVRLNIRRSVIVVQVSPRAARARGARRTSAAEGLKAARSFLVPFLP
jgi:hypothetical protein